MEELWRRFKYWISQNANHLISILAPGAIQSDFLRIETATGIILPQDFKDFYSIHNGQLLETEGIIDGERLLTTDRILNEWTTWNDLLIKKSFESDEGIPYKSDPDHGIKDVWWNPKWIPFTSNHSGDSICIDLDPSPFGNQGQIITMWHDAGWREMLGNSFNTWITNYISDLERGRYIYINGMGIIDKEFA